MRLTLRLCKLNMRRMKLDKWRNKGYVRAVPASKPNYVKDELLYDPRIPDKPREVCSSEDPVIVPFFTKKTREEHPDYHSDGDFVYEYHNKSRLMRGLNQACILTKTLSVVGLPESALKNVGLLDIPDQDMLVQRSIMQANVWDPTKDKLPRRINKRLPGWRFKAEFGISERKTRAILLRNLMRLCQMIGAKHPDLLLSRSLMSEPYMSTTYYFQGQHRILVRALYDFLVCSERPLDPFASTEMVDRTATFDLPSLHPVSPTIDLLKQKLFKEGENITGYKDGFKYANPHTMVLEGSKRMAPDELNARMLMLAFGLCTSVAKQKYGDSVTTLDQPISTQVVLTDGSNFHFGCFQLNTLNLDSSTGIKNLVWFDNRRAMYQKILPERAMLRNTRYEDYDPEVFKLLLGLYLNGADLSKEWSVTADSLRQ